MPKRRRLLTPMKSRNKSPRKVDDVRDQEVSNARGRLKGALIDAMEPIEESDGSIEQSPEKRERNLSQELARRGEYTSDEEDNPPSRRSPPRQSYVLKLFDRSVDLSQFKEDSPLYPICRAWMVNQPKANYMEYGKRFEEPEPEKDSIELPGPEGPPVSRIPDLLPEQKARNKDIINLNYREAPPPSREQLLQAHLARWAAVRNAWLEQAATVEARYSATQDLLTKINVSPM